MVILALTAGTALASASAPSTTAHLFSSHPMISGTVVTVNDRRMVVDTDQGEQVTLELDSRTMAPRDLEPGMVMRAEFRALEDCRLYAERVIPIRSGMSTARLQAYANTHDSRHVIDRNASASSGHVMHHNWSQATTADRVTSPQQMGEHSPGRIMTALPTTEDNYVSTRTQISGRALTVNDHWLAMVTDQGQAVGLAMDSRTMLPRDVGPGSILRVEFSEMRDGRYYAKRIRLVDSRVTDREQAYANTRDSDILLAQSVSECGPMMAAPSAMTSVVEQREPVAPPPAVVAERAPVAETAAMLPQTASSQPLLLLMGLLALGASAAFAIGRRLHHRA